MTFDLTGLVIFLLAVMPGFIAQQSRYRIAPRSIEQKSTIEEMGDYVLNSALIHLVLLSTFSLFIGRTVLASIPSSFQRDLFFMWAWNHRWLVLLYFLTSPVFGPPFGFLRGIVALKHPTRSGFLALPWCRWLLAKIGVHSFLENEKRRLLHRRTAKLRPCCR